MWCRWKWRLNRLLLEFVVVWKSFHFLDLCDICILFACLLGSRFRRLFLNLVFIDSFRVLSFIGVLDGLGLLSLDWLCILFGLVLRIKFFPGCLFFACFHCIVVAFWGVYLMAVLVWMICCRYCFDKFWLLNLSCLLNQFNAKMSECLILILDFIFE